MSQEIYFGLDLKWKYFFFILRSLTQKIIIPFPPSEQFLCDETKQIAGIKSISLCRDVAAEKFGASRQSHPLWKWNKKAFSLSAAWSWKIDATS